MSNATNPAAALTAASVRRAAMIAALGYRPEYFALIYAASDECLEKRCSDRGIVVR